MLNTAQAVNHTNNVSMHHDLWVELAMIEMRMERLDPAANDTGEHQLQERRAQLRHAMELLPE